MWHCEVQILTRINSSLEVTMGVDLDRFIPSYFKKSNLNTWRWVGLLFFVAKDICKLSPAEFS